MSTRVAGTTMVTAAVTDRSGASSGSLLWLNIGLLGLVLASAFAVIHSTHSCRELYTRLQVLESRQWHLQEDYGRLLLEESTWASHHRVEKVAREDLSMAGYSDWRLPDAKGTEEGSPVAPVSDDRAAVKYALAAGGQGAVATDSGHRARLCVFAEPG